MPGGHKCGATSVHSAFRQFENTPQLAPPPARAASLWGLPSSLDPPKSASGAPEAHLWGAGER
eukprot:5785363-Alexandrium_andersonii.AAC.1